MSTDIPADIRPLVDAILADALALRASDIHVEPTGSDYEIRLRIDGLLQTVAHHPTATGRAIVARLMVLAQLLTYRLDIPQEGRITLPSSSSTPSLDLRLAIMPTAHGLRAAVRLPADLLQPKGLDELALPASVLAGLKQFASADSGMLILTGPAGSGKTTTIYALLSYMVSRGRGGEGGESIITLEDPVERHLPGVTQIEVSPFGQLTYERALKSILRQDPQILMLGEIRDAATASLAIQAALSGHRLICTLHAADAASAVARLFEMGLEPYQITSALFAIISQRLLRRLSPTSPSSTSSASPYRGRVPVAEIAFLDDPLRQAILHRGDTAQFRTCIEKQSTFRPLRQVAGDLVEQHLTDRREVVRVFG